MMKNISFGNVLIAVESLGLGRTTDLSVHIAAGISSGLLVSF